MLVVKNLEARSDSMPRAPEKYAWSACSRTIFLCLLERIEVIVESVSRSLKLSAADTDDFKSTVSLHFIEGDYRVLRHFRGECSWNAFLNRVVRNLGYDFQNQRLGKWQPSRKALELGYRAVRLEILMTRDGFTFEEAAARLVGEGLARGVSELIELEARLPCRYRRQFFDEESLRDFPSPSRVDSRLENGELERELARLGSALETVLGSLGRDERMLLKLRYAEGHTLVEIARVLGLRQRQAYSFHDRCLHRLRRRLEREGISPERAILAFHGDSAQLDIDFDTGRVTIYKLARCWRPGEASLKSSTSGG